MRGSVAQLVEQRTFNPLVVGSNPARPTILQPTLLEIKLSVLRPLLLVTQIQKIDFGYVVLIMMGPIEKCGLLEISVIKSATVSPLLSRKQ